MRMPGLLSEVFRCNSETKELRSYIFLLLQAVLMVQGVQVFLQTIKADRHLHTAALVLICEHTLLSIFKQKGNRALRVHLCKLSMIPKYHLGHQDSPG